MLSQQDRDLEKFLDDENEEERPHSFRHSTAIPLNSASEDQSEPGVVLAPATTKKSCFSLSFLLYLVPLIYATTEASQTAMGMKDDERDFAISCIALTFLTAFAMNATPTIDGIKEVYQSIIGEPPGDLPVISQRKKYLSLGFATVFTGYVAFSDTLQAWYFGASIPEEYQFKADGWVAATILMSTATAVNTLFSEGLRNYRFAHQVGMSLETNFNHVNRFSRIASPITGVVLGGLSGLNDTLLSLVGMASVLRIREKSTGLYVITALSVMNGLSETTLQYHYLNETTDSIIKTLSTRCPTLKEVASTSIAFNIACYVAVSAQRLSMQLLGNFADLYDIKPTDSLVTTASAFAFLDALDYTLIGTMYLYPLVFNLFSQLQTIGQRFRPVQNANNTHHDELIRDRCFAFPDETKRLLNTRQATDLSETSVIFRPGEEGIPLRLFDNRLRLGERIENQMEARGYRLR